MINLRKIGVLAVALLSLTAGWSRAETALWKDTFEGAATSRWAVTNSVWHVGSPTTGPAVNAAGYRTYSGTNCASTQGYLAGRDVRLVCTNYNGSNYLTVPGASQFPRLRFWHWFNFANALGYVEIRSGTNGWQQISATYGPTANATGGGVWSRPAIDLSGYAGQSVQIAFHFTSGGTVNGQGWFIDDVAVVTNTPALNGNPETFEAGQGDWGVDAGTWQIGGPTSGPNAAHTGTNCAATILAGNYPNNVDSRLISPPFTVPTNSGQYLRFWHWYNFNNNALGDVEIRSTSSNSWVQLSPTWLNASSGGWTNALLDLSTYAGQTIQAAFHFTSISGNTAAGWYVDDLSIVSAPTITNQPVSLTNDVSSNAVFSVTAGDTLGGTIPLSYQWFYSFTGSNGWHPILTATNSTLTLTNLQTNNSAYYCAIVTNLYGSVTSVTNARLTVWSKPVFSKQPVSQSILIGSNATFTVAASGNRSLTYQWFYSFTGSNGWHPILTATNSTLTLTNLALTNAAYYCVIVGDGYGSVTSVTNARLTLWLPAITNAVKIKNGGPFQFTFTPVAGLTNSVLTNGFLIGGIWNVFTNVPPSGTPSPITIADLPGTGSRFYRVQVLP